MHTILDSTRVRMLAFAVILFGGLALSTTPAYAQTACTNTTSGATVCEWDGTDCNHIVCCTNGGGCGSAVPECGSTCEEP